MIRQRAAMGFAIGAFAVITMAVNAQVVTFEQLPNPILSANDMSPDGRYIVGEADQNGDGFADGTYRWDNLTDTLTILPPEGLIAAAVSNDGSTILGDMPDPNDPDPTLGVVAGMWTESTGWQSLGYLPNAGECPSRSDGYELSADGSVAVGLSWDGCSGRGFIWTQATGMLELQNLANGSNRASVVSADGTVIGGFAQGSSSRTPAIWDDTTAGELLDPPNGDAVGEIYGISDDGSILLGTWTKTNPVALATKWTWNGAGWDRATIDAGALLPGWTGIPEDIANDGTIVGFDFLVGNRRAWIQPHGTGPLQELVSYIESHGGDVPDGLPLQVCQAISADGRYIIGHGAGTGAWRVTIDYPLTADFDGDGDVDTADFGLFAQCFAGAANPPAAGCPAGVDADLDDDGDVDTSDFGLFSQQFTGSL